MCLSYPRAHPLALVPCLRSEIRPTPSQHSAYSVFHAGISRSIEWFWPLQPPKLLQGGQNRVLRVNLRRLAAGGLRLVFEIQSCFAPRDGRGDGMEIGMQRGLSFSLEFATGKDGPGSRCKSWPFPCTPTTPTFPRTPACAAVLAVKGLRCASMNAQKTRVFDRSGRPRRTPCPHMRQRGRTQTQQPSPRGMERRPIHGRSSFLTSPRSKHFRFFTKLMLEPLSRSS